MRLESWLRGVLLALVAFLTASGLGTVFVERPGVRVQVVQLAHAAVGAAALAVVLGYLAVHVRESLRGLRRARRAVPAWIRALVVVALLAQGVALFDVPAAVRAVLGPLGVLALAAFLLAIVVALIRQQAAGTGGAIGAGGVAALALLLGFYEGLETMVGFRLYGDGASSPQRLHLLFVALGLALVTAHVLSARRRAARRHGATRLEHPWRGPLLRVALPVLAVLVLVTALQVRRIAALAPAVAVDERALVAVDRGFETVTAACTTCHPEVVDDWSGSAHALAAANPVFERLVSRIRAEGGAEQARFCLRCHAPHAPDPVGRPWEEVLGSAGYAAGVACVSCHRSAPGPGHGDGSMIGLPASRGGHLFLGEHPGEVLAWTRRAPWAPALVRSRLGLHRAEQRSASREATSCLPCHVQTLREPTGGRVGSVLQDQYDSWQGSSLAEAGVDCKHCHFPRYVSIAGYDVADHRSLGASTYLASLDPDPARSDALVDVLRGGWPLASIEQGVRHRPPARAPLLAMRASARCAGDGRRLDIDTEPTRRIGHSFPNGPTDLIQVWLALRVRDGEGRVLLEQGADGPGDALRLGHRLEDASGAEVEGHRLWLVERVVDRGHVPVDGEHRHSVVLPPLPGGADLEVRAAWRYRRLDPALLEGTGLDAERALPVVEVGVVETRLTTPDCPAP